MYKIITAISIALAGASFAQPGAQPVAQPVAQPDTDSRNTQRGHRQAFMQRMHDRFDADGDGQLSGDERAAAHGARQGRMDENRARVLDRIQSKSLADLPEPVALALAEFDLDDSLSIDDDERVLLELELDARIEAKKAEILAKFDADNDGVLSQNERKAAREARRAQHVQRRAEMLSKYDANGDGALDQSERETLRAEQGPPPGDPLLRLFRSRRGPGGPHADRGPRQGRHRGARQIQD